MDFSWINKTDEIDNVKINKEIEKIIDKPIKNKKEWLKTILSCIDLTTLSGTDNTERIEELCKKSYSFRSKNKELPNVAAVCFYPVFAKEASNFLKGNNISLACVAGSFPSGQSLLSIRLEEVKKAVEHGANEIDMVISRGQFLEPNFEFVYNEIHEHKKACGNAHLKVILETGELQSLKNIMVASQIAIDAGADFIKTSTGKIEPGATLEAFYIMCEVIKDHFEKTGKMIGIKPAGGISDTETALKYISVLYHILGEKWLNKKHFRIGASRLADRVVEEILQS